MSSKISKAHYHLPGLFEHYELYRVLLPLYASHREYFYDWCDIGSIYGAPHECIWGGGRVEISDSDPREVFSLLNEYDISARLTFSNSLLEEKHLNDAVCNELCALLSRMQGRRGGIIVHSDLLLEYLKAEYPDLYYVSSTTKVLTGFDELRRELEREEFEYVVPDFRLNKDFGSLRMLDDRIKNKAEFLCNECCLVSCRDRKACYEAVSRKNLGLEGAEHICRAPGSEAGYVFSRAMEGPAFIGTDDITDVYMPMGFSNFKIEGRGLGSALILEFILYYMTRPEYQLKVREEVYLTNMLDLF